MSEWQPIETAPKGRKVIVGYRNKLGNWRTVMAHYYLPNTLVMADYCDEEYGAEGWYEDTETHSEETLPTDELPTHWMPLPAPPNHER